MDGNLKRHRRKNAGSRADRKACRKTVPIDALTTVLRATWGDVFETFVNTEYHEYATDTGDIWEAGKVLPGGYRILRELGRGGIGTVYLVEKKLTSRILRFAVKTLHRDIREKPSVARLFLRELKLWMRLPEHPNLVTCRFFQTIEGRLAIFSDYISGGSLAQWIGAGRITDLKTVLGIALQLARGLDTAHRCGVVHRDVKPANVLMTDDGEAKLTDFGIASPVSGVTVGVFESGDAKREMSGMTIVYCSPEQAMKREVGAKTDMWSWALVVFEMLAGKALWNLGLLGADAFRRYCREDGEAWGTALPEALVELLRRCFEEDPERRWESMGEVVERIESIYARVAGSPYSPVVKGSGDERMLRGSLRAIKRRSNRVGEALDLLDSAYRAAGSSLPEERFRAVLAQQEMPEYLLELELLTEADDIYRRIAGRKRGVDTAWAILLLRKGKVQRRCGDLPGAAVTIDTAEEIISGATEDKYSLRIRTWAEIKLEKAYLEMWRFNYKEALMRVEEASALLQESAFPPEDVEIRMVRARSLMGKGYILSVQKEAKRAIRMFDQAIEVLRETSVGDDGDETAVANELAKAYAQKATVLGQMGEIESARAMFRKAASIWEPLVFQGNRWDLALNLANVYRNDAIVLRMLGRAEDVLHLFVEVVDILETSIYQYGNTDFLQDLAVCYMNAAVGYRNLDRMNAALEHYDKAKKLLEYFVFQENREDVLPDLAATYSNESVCWESLGSFDKAIECERKAVQIWARVMCDSNREVFAVDYAGSYANMGQYYVKQGRYDYAEHAFKKGYKIASGEWNDPSSVDLNTTIMLLNINLSLAELMILMKRKNEIRPFVEKIFENISRLKSRTWHRRIKHFIHRIKTLLEPYLTDEQRDLLFSLETDVQADEREERI